MDKNNFKKQKENSAWALSNKAYLQIGLAAAMLLLSVGFVLLFSSGVISSPEAEHVMPPTVDQELSGSSQNGYKEETVLTAEEIIGAFEPFSDGDRLIKELYGDGFALKRLDASLLGAETEAELSVRMGFVFKTVEGVTRIYDSSLADITASLEGYSFAGLRDGEGFPLFVKDGSYYRIKDGFITEAEYRAADYDKGISYDYPSYLAGCDRGFEVFSRDGLYGLRRTDDGSTVVPAEYADVYGVSEGLICAVDSDGALFVFDTEGEELASGFLGAEKENRSGIGYYFFYDGLTRARTQTGEVMLHKSGTLLDVPKDFTVEAYSDGMILLSKGDKCGFMNSKGAWACDPVYSDAEPFYEGLAVVENRKGKYGIIDRNGTELVPCAFDRITNCSDGLILLYEAEYGWFALAKTA